MTNRPKASLYYTFYHREDWHSRKVWRSTLIHTGAILQLSLSQPLAITIVEGPERIEQILEPLRDMAPNALMVVHEVEVSQDILFGNFLGLIPGMQPATADTDITWGLAVICFFFFLYQGFRHQGLAYLKSFLGPIRKLSWLPLMILMLLNEIIGNPERPFSLGIRLFANMFADHNVLGVFTGLTKLVVPIAFYALGSLVCVVQAFVFVLLAMIYVVMASHEH